MTDDPRESHDHDREADDGWVPPVRTDAVRRISGRSRGSARPIFTTPDNREMRVESGLEATAAHILQQRSDVVSVREQAARIQYQDARGAPAHHVPDFLVTLRNGKRIAVLVKPAALAERRNARDLVDRLAASISPDLADTVVLVTEGEATPGGADWARLVRRARACPNAAHEAAVLAVQVLVNGPMTVRALIALTDLHGGDGFDACVRLVATGALRRVGAGRFSPESLVAFAAEPR